VRAQDFEVLVHAGEWCEENIGAWLCTIVQATGSSPRPVGAMLAFNDEGLQVGSVSGGCIEEDLLERLRSGQLEGPFPCLIDYGVSPEENERLGLPCGGRLKLLLQRLDNDDSAWLQRLLAALNNRECIARRVSLETGHTSVTPADHYAPLHLDEREVCQSFGPRMRMLLVGAGQLARSLSELALAMDYDVLVTDPRKQFLEQWEGPDIPLLPGMPDDVVRSHANDRFSVIITLTHDPRIDDMALMEALASDAWYVGALGSIRTTEVRLLRLAQLDLSSEQIARLHAPVGLDIGSKTPNEIAVAIMAELISLRRKR
jgi:xanthine dehydrogenase accessory factor